MENMEKQLLNKLDEICCFVDGSGTITWVNNAVNGTLGCTPDSMIGTKPENWGRRYRKIESEKNSGKLREIWVFNHSDGSTRHMECTAIPFSGSNGDSTYLVLSRDISSQISREKKLQELLKEKETLMKDLHHRVKNNLTMVSSLVALSAVKAEDEVSKGILDDLAARIYSISIIHELLYKGNDLQQLDLPGYLEALVDAQLAGISGNGKQISFINKMEPVTLKTKKCIPLGLIVTELATNSLKHAFRDRASGSITIELKKEKKGLLLIYCDDGPGMPEGMDCKSSNTLGFTLVESLSKQLHAGFHCEHENSFKLVLTIPVNWEKE